MLPKEHVKKSVNISIPLLKGKTFRRLLWGSLGIIASVYVVGIETPMYQSNTDIVVKKVENQQTANFGAFFPVNNKVEDIMILEKYLQSREVFDFLDTKYDLRKMYSSEDIDFVQRMYKWNKVEDYMNLYLKHLQFTYDEISGVISIGFLHMNPKFSKRIVEDLLYISENKLNTDNKELTLKQLQFISMEKEKLRVTLENSIKSLEQYQNNNLVLDPKNNTTAIVANINSLNEKLMAKKMELSKLSSYQTDSSIEIINLRKDIEELQKSSSELNNMLVGKGENKMNTKVVDFQKIEEDIKLYKELYLKSLINLQVLKSEILKKSKVIQVISNPVLPESHSKPKYLYSLFSIWITIFILYGLHSMIKGILKDRKL
jgi:capsular polysaccharide transport system permease protein